MRILNFGTLCAECIYSVESLDFSGDTLELGSSQTFAGGRGLNVSVALSRAGISKIHHAGYIGDSSEFLREALKNSGVNTANLKSVDKPSAHSIVLLENGARSKKLYFKGTNGEVSKEFAETVLSRFSAEDVLIIDDGVSNFDSIISMAHARNMRIFFAPENPNVNLDLNLISYLFINETQAKNISNSDSREDIAEFFKKKYSLVRVVIDFGANGYLYIGKTQTLFQSALKTAHIDFTAGFDTFIGFFIASVLKGKKLSNAMLLAATALALCSARKGSAFSIPYESEVLGALDSLEEYQTSENNRTIRLKSRVEEYIENNIKSAKIKDLSVVLGYSEVYTGELIKSTFGISFSQILQEKRCSLAAKLLRATRMSVKEIITTVGYDNETFFRKKFKSIYGVNPNDYRKNA